MSLAFVGLQPCCCAVSDAAQVAPAPPPPPALGVAPGVAWPWPEGASGCWGTGTYAESQVAHAGGTAVPWAVACCAGRTLSHRAEWWGWMEREGRLLGGGDHKVSLEGGKERSRQRTDEGRDAQGAAKARLPFPRGVGCGCCERWRSHGAGDSVSVPSAFGESPSGQVRGGPPGAMVMPSAGQGAQGNWPTPSPLLPTGPLPHGDQHPQDPLLTGAQRPQAGCAAVVCRGSWEEECGA